MRLSPILWAGRLCPTTVKHVSVTLFCFLMLHLVTGLPAFVQAEQIPGADSSRDKVLPGGPDGFLLNVRGFNGSTGIVANEGVLVFNDFKSRAGLFAAQKDQRSLHDDVVARALPTISADQTILSASLAERLSALYPRHSESSRANAQRTANSFSDLSRYGVENADSLSDGVANNVFASDYARAYKESPSQGAGKRIIRTVSTHEPEPMNRPWGRSIGRNKGNSCFTAWRCGPAF